ncbi:response regulator transcription factor [Nocardioides sp. HM23]|uniref:helix-turn-helix transcriptional regulator n=1 Tax=Nocardioides bizhenqiangii TaxID=3095076 RepID=UPI002ACAB8FD|nr:response regulator transcription factor [Nocardioides sp. HM23]MDZ5620611.1 response regulator transcription factor [Nocardioides sp. HM23]
MISRPRIAWAAITVTLAILLATVAISADTGLWKLVLIALALGLPGALSATLHPRNAVGWLLLAVALAFASLGLASQWLDAGHESSWATLAVDRVGAIVVPLTVLALLLVPDGRLPSPRWRPVAVAVVCAQLAVIVAWTLVRGSPASPNPIGVLPADWAGAVDTIGSWVLQGPLLLAIAAVVFRLRRPADRTNLAALLWGVAGFALLAVGGHVFWPAAADALDTLGATLLGAGITVTLLRVPEPIGIDWSNVDTPELSPREREVLELVAEGLTNREIAERLFISPVTARNHVSRILTKLSLENRTQAATWLSQRGSRSPDSLAS